MKNRGLGKDPLSWIRPTTIEGKQREPTEKSEKLKKIPKYKTFDVRLTTLLNSSQVEFLEQIVREIHRNRTSEYKKERITKNTLIRVFIEAFTYTKFDTKNIPDEETLLSRVLKVIKSS